MRGLDLADRASIAAFTAAWDAPLHLLVNNAGVMALPERTLTVEGLEGVGGRYFEDCREAEVIAGTSASDGRHGVAPFALDPENARRLWTVSERLLAPN